MEPIPGLEVQIWVAEEGWGERYEVFGLETLASSFGWRKE